MAPPPPPRGGTEDLSSIFPPVPSFQFETLDLPIATTIGLGLGIGFGIGLGFILFTRSRSIKPLSTAIKAADSVIKGTKVLQDLHSPSPRAIIFASKMLIQGYKASKRFIPARASLGRHPFIAKRLRAYWGAINLVRYVTSPPYADGFLGLALLKGGYKFSKNFLKVLEGFVGLQLDSALKNGVDTLGLLVRVVFVARELKQWIVVGWPRKKRHECGFARRGDMRYGTCSCLERTNFDGDCRCVRGFPVENFPKLERAVFSEMPLELCLSELLCLSIPIHEVIPMKLL